MAKIRLHELHSALSARREQRMAKLQSVQDGVTRLEPLPKPDPKPIDGTYRHASLLVPREIDACPGISVFGRRIRSLVFSTDLAIICNCDADAVFAVYPFTCQPIITQALVNASGRPVFTGVAGTTTTGTRSASMAVQAEMQGAFGVVVNSPTTAEDVRAISRGIDIPLVLTVVDFDKTVMRKIDAGAKIVNVAAGKETPRIVEAVRSRYPELPIIASGGKDASSVKSTISAGADAITWVPPTMQQLQRELMDKNRADVAGAEPETDPEPEPEPEPDVA